MMESAQMVTRNSDGAIVAASPIMAIRRLAEDVGASNDVAKTAEILCLDRIARDDPSATDACRSALTAKHFAATMLKAASTLEGDDISTRRLAKESGGKGMIISRDGKELANAIKSAGRDLLDAEPISIAGKGPSPRSGAPPMSIGLGGTNLSKETINVAESILDASVKANLSKGRSIEGLKAAAIYMAGKYTGQEITQKEAADITGSSDSSVKRIYKKIASGLSNEIKRGTINGAVKIV